jgi:NAD-dependent SIR2 family protein deacetylase
MHRTPMTIATFLSSHAARQRYWARSSIGYGRIVDAQPNPAHRALARLQQLGRIETLVTQNVDGLHQRAGSSNVVDLHGQLSNVECVSCKRVTARDALQPALRRQLMRSRSDLNRVSSRSFAPDGDAELDDAEHRDFVVPTCNACGGILKPAVVFFGETVPPQRVAAAYAGLERSDALLVAGSSLMVFSGYRFVKRAATYGKPIAIVNVGKTRADALAHLKIQGGCASTLTAAVAHLH